jgi:hypothetical protein
MGVRDLVYDRGISHVLPTYALRLRHIWCGLLLWGYLEVLVNIGITILCGSVTSKCKEKWQVNCHSRSNHGSTKAHEWWKQLIYIGGWIHCIACRWYWSRYDSRTSVNERTKEIGTMKAIGAKPLFILSMFLSDAVVIGLIGSTMGIGTGIGLAYLLAALGASGGAASHITPIFLPNDLVRVWLLSVSITLAAGIFPAWKASRLSPLVAMRAL